jgi:hypothetical protein
VGSSSKNNNLDCFSKKVELLLFSLIRIIFSKKLI